MAFAFEPLRLILASSSAPAFFASSPVEMMALAQPTPSLPPEPRDLSSAPSPSHSIYKTLHYRLLMSTTSLDLNDTRSGTSDCSRRLMLPSPGSVSLRPRSRDSVSHLHSRRLMCPSPPPLPRSHVNFSGSSNHFLVRQDLCSNKGFDLDLNHRFPSSFPV